MSLKIPSQAKDLDSGTYQTELLPFTPPIVQLLTLGIDQIFCSVSILHGKFRELKEEIYIAQ
jgi:hypothetical protein